MVDPEKVRRKLLAAERYPVGSQPYVTIEPLELRERDFLVEAVKVVESLQAIMFYIGHRS